MEDEANFVPDYDEDFVVIDEAGDDVPEEEEFVIVDSIDDGPDEEVNLREVNLEDFVVIDEYVAPPEFEPLKITITQDLPALQVTVRSIVTRPKKHSNIKKKKSQAEDSTNALDV